MRIFVTGTDTGIGKTYISVALLNAFASLNYKTIGLKPIASGAEKVNDQWLNEDALALQQAATIHLPYAEVNPFVFQQPIAPHLAARKQGMTLNANQIIDQLTPSMSIAVDVAIVEGVGGWNVPINDEETLLPMIKYFCMHVVLVVGLRLGCINHAILTAQAISNAKLPFLGWIANVYQPAFAFDNDLIETLKTWIPVPYLGLVPYRGRLCAVK